MSQDFEAFFKNRGLVATIDFMAARYGKLPTEILQDLSVWEYMFNEAVMHVGHQVRQAPPVPEDQADKRFAEYKIDRKVLTREEAERAGLRCNEPENHRGHPRPIE